MIAFLLTQIAKLKASISSTNNNIAKYVLSEKESESTNGNADGAVVLDMPTGATTIKTIIPIGYTPSSSWDTKAQFTTVVVSNRQVRFRTIGNTAQTYTIRAIVVYI